MEGGSMRNSSFFGKNAAKNSTNTRHIACFLTLMLLGLLAQGCVQAGEESIQWKTFEFPEDGFSILMPGKPEKVDLLPRSKFYGKEDLTGAKQVRYQVRFENPPWYSVDYRVAVSVASDSLKKAIAGADSFLPVRQAFISNFTGQIIREREVKYKNTYAGYEIEFKRPMSYSGAPGSKGIARTYIVGSTTFLLEVVYKSGTTASPEISQKNVSEFFDSFQILSVDGKQPDK
ncbi:MAG: hypothetical protein PHV97_04590 [Candidatus Omnitrophica bacterium]|nr:hypothetical protein [Candidatus Omnitrophota bacterium]